MEGQKGAILDVITKNLDPELAQQVKETWFDPQTVCVQQLLGNGKLPNTLQLQNPLSLF